MTRRDVPAALPWAVPPPLELSARVFKVGRREFAVLEWKTRVEALPEGLSPAEHQVVRLVLAGWSNARIGAARGTSARTVANQLAGVFRKLSVHSRHELHSRALRRGRSS